MQRTSIFDIDSYSKKQDFVTSLTSPTDKYLTVMTPISAKIEVSKSPLANYDLMLSNDRNKKSAGKTSMSFSFIHDKHGNQHITKKFKRKKFSRD